LDVGNLVLAIVVILNYSQAVQPTRMFALPSVGASTNEKGVYTISSDKEKLGEFSYQQWYEVGRRSVVVLVVLLKLFGRLLYVYLIRAPRYHPKIGQEQDIVPPR